MIPQSLTWLLSLIPHDHMHVLATHKHFRPPPCSDSKEKAFMMSDDGASTRTRTRKHKRNRTYCVDSGASVHCINDASMFDHVYAHHPPVKVTVANKQVLTATKIGTVKVNLTNQHNKPRTITLHNVVYHPNFSENLLSVRRLWKDSRMSTTFEGSNYFKDKSTGDKYKFQSTQSGYELHAYATILTEDPQLLHSRFGHCSERRLNKLRDRSINFPHTDPHASIKHDPLDCDACQAGGMRKRPFSKRPKGRYTYFGEKLSSDLCMFPKSIQGYKYVLCIVDAYSNWLVTIPLKSKHSSHVHAAMQSFIHKYEHY